MANVCVGGKLSEIFIVQILGLDDLNRLKGTAGVQSVHSKNTSLAIENGQRCFVRVRRLWTCEDM